MAPTSHEPAFLVMVNVAEEDWSYRIDDQPKTIGRSTQAAVRVPPQFERVSRRHAEVWQTRTGIMIRDLGSRGGTRVNGVCLDHGREATIAIGDRIVLSDMELKVVASVSKLAELMAEASIPSGGPQKKTEEGKTTVSLKLDTADIVRMTLQQLTPAELEIVLWMHRGYMTDEALGEALYRSPHTIRTQMTGILAKLAVKSRADVLAWLKRASDAAARAARPDPRTGYKTKTW